MTVTFTMSGLREIEVAARRVSGSAPPESPVIESIAAAGDAASHGLARRSAPPAARAPARAASVTTMYFWKPTPAKTMRKTSASRNGRTITNSTMAWPRSSSPWFLTIRVRSLDLAPPDGSGWGPREGPPTVQDSDYQLSIAGDLLISQRDRAASPAHRAGAGRVSSDSRMIDLPVSGCCRRRRRCSGIGDRVGDIVDRALDRARQRVPAEAAPIASATTTSTSAYSTNACPSSALEALAASSPAPSLSGSPHR